MRITRIGAAAVALILPLSGCDELDGNDTESVSLSFASSFGPTSLVGSIEVAPPIGDGVNILDLTGLSLTLDEIKLERSEAEEDGDSDGESDGASGDSDSEADSDSDGPGDSDFGGSDSVTIDIPLDGDVVTEVTVPVPSGNYEELEVDVASVRLVGTFNGETFDVLVPIDLEVETEFDPPVSVDESINLTVSLDLGAWLREADGSVIDPRQLTTDAAMRARLIQRIAVSLNAFEDEDGDGDESDSDSDLDSDDGSDDEDSDED